MLFSKGGQHATLTAVNVRRFTFVRTPYNEHSGPDKITVIIAGIQTFVDQQISAHRAILRVFRKFCVSAYRAERELSVFFQSDYRPYVMSRILVFIRHAITASGTIK